MSLGERISSWKHFARAAYALGEASNGLNLILLAVIARVMGVEPYGQFMAIMAAAGILSELMEFGFPMLLTRAIARRPQSAWPALRLSLLKQALMIPLMLAILYAYMSFTHLPADAHWAGLLMGASFGLRALKSSARAVCRGLNLFGLESIFLWSERLALLVFGVAALQSGGGLWELSLIFFGVRLVDFAIYMHYMKRSVKEHPVPAAEIAREISFATAFPFALSGILFSLYYQVNTVMLSLLSTAYETGIYAAIFRFVEILAVIPRLVIVVAFPAMAVAWLADQGRFRDTVERLQRVMTTLALPVLCGLVVWSREVLVLIFGPEYAAGAQALRVILLGVYFLFSSMLFCQVMQSAAHEKMLANTLLVTVVLNLLLNFWLIPQHGFMGAAVATVITEGVFMLALWILAQLTRTARRSLAYGYNMAGAVVLTLLVFWLR